MCRNSASYALPSRGLAFQALMIRPALKSASVSRSGDVCDNDNVAHKADDGPPPFNQIRVRRSHRQGDRKRLSSRLVAKTMPSHIGAAIAPVRRPGLAINFPNYKP